MKTLTFTEFRKNASHVLDLVEKGESIRVLRHGRAIAKIVPADLRESNLPGSDLDSIWRRPAPRWLERCWKRGGRRLERLSRLLSACQAVCPGARKRSGGGDFVRGIVVRGFDDLPFGSRFRALPTTPGEEAFATAIPQGLAGALPRPRRFEHHRRYGSGGGPRRRAFGAVAAAVVRFPPGGLGGGVGSGPVRFCRRKAVRCRTGLWTSSGGVAGGLSKAVLHTRWRDRDSLSPSGAQSR